MEILSIHLSGCDLQSGTQENITVKQIALLLMEIRLQVVYRFKKVDNEMEIDEEVEGAALNSSRRR